MNRMDEWQALTEQLEQAPPALDGLSARVKTRARQQRSRKILGIPLASLGGIAAAFVLLINLSLPFALACSGNPLLAPLARAAALSPSLKAAVESGYGQYVGQTQTVDGLTLHVEYLVVDQRQVNIFLQVKQGGDNVDCLISGTLTGQEGYISLSGNTDGDEYAQVTFDFEEDTPDALDVTFSVEVPPANNSGEPPISIDTPPDSANQPKTNTTDFSFHLTFDPEFKASAQIYTIQQWIPLDGQQIFADRLEVYPTHAQLHVVDDADNTAWLVGLDFYLTDEKGATYHGISNGISASGGTGSPFFTIYRIESSFFSDARPLTLSITGGTWLEKDRQYVQVNLLTAEAFGLPTGVSLSRIEKIGDYTVLEFEETNMDQTSQIFHHHFLDGEVKREFSTSAWRILEETDGTRSITTLYLPHPNETEIFLPLVWSQLLQLDTPIQISLS